jgi:hypothetical protein
MQAQSKFTRSFAAVGALVFGCFSILFGGFIRDVLAVAAIASEGTIFSLGMEKGARLGYMRTLCITVIVLISSLCYIKLYFKTVLEKSFSAIVFDEFGPTDSSGRPDPNYVPAPQKAMEYWKKY